MSGSDGPARLAAGRRSPIAREGAPFFLPPLIAGLVLLALAPYRTVGLGLAGLGILVALFFRDPERTVAGGAAAVVSPADGRVVRLARREDGCTELSIFLSPLDVHINRSPVSGKLVDAVYRKGRFRPAFDPRATQENEQILLKIDGDHGPIEMREVTGVLVRRIVLWKRPGDRLERGERIGLMKFGSRIDLTLPPDVHVRVKLGERVRGAESILGEVHST